MATTHRYAALALAVGGLVGLTGCGGGGGGGGGADAATTSQLTSGVITGFGSVYVDGVKFETVGSSFSLDDRPGSEDDLSVGMVVTVHGSINADGRTGTATHIEYDDELEGVVISTAIDADGTGSMNIMGQTVHIGPTTVFESEVSGITSLNEVVAGNVVEVSGYASGEGTIFATRLEVKRAAHNGEEIEVKGLIADLTGTTFTIGSLSVDYSTTRFEDIPGGVLVEGLYVEVKSTSGFNGAGHLVASEVELEDGGDMDLDGEDGEDADISGIVTGVVSDTVFEIDGQVVRIVENTEFEHGAVTDIVDGVRLRVEGYFDASGDLIAEEIEFGESGDGIEMEGTLEAVSGSGAEGSVTLFGQTILVNPMTLLVDEQDDNGIMPVRYFGLSDLAGGDYVEIDAYRDDTTGDLVAVKLERDDQDEDGDRLEGVIEDIPATDTLLVAGVTVDVSGVSMPAIAPGDEVEIDGSYDVGSGVFNASGVEVDD